MRRPLLGLSSRLSRALCSLGRSVCLGGNHPGGDIGGGFFSAALRKEGSLKPERLWPLFFVLSFLLGALRCQWSDAANEEKARRVLRESTGWDVLLEACAEGPLERREDRFRLIADKGTIIDSRGGSHCRAEC
jgi:hypothetical protein